MTGPDQAKLAMCVLQAGSRISAVRVHVLGGDWVELEIETEHGQIRITGSGEPDANGWKQPGRLEAERVK